MNVIFTVLFAFPIGFVVRRRGTAVVGYLAADAILLNFQTLNVLHDSWLGADGRIELSNGDTLAYSGVNLVIVLVGVGLVVLGGVAAARRAARNSAVSVG